MKKRCWIIGGIAIIGLASLVGHDTSPASLCIRSATKAALDQDFISKLSRLGARLKSDYALQGRQGEAVVCSVSFELMPLTKESMAALDKDYHEPTTVAEAERDALTALMLPNMLVHASGNPGQPLVQRITYRVNETLDGRVLVTVVSFPGARK